MAPRIVFIPLREVCRQTGLSKSEIYRRMDAGTFPKQAHISTRARWVEQEVQDWNAQWVQKRDKGEAA